MSLQYRVVEMEDGMFAVQQRSNWPWLGWLNTWETTIGRFVTQKDAQKRIDQIAERDRGFRVKRVVG